MNIAAPVQRNVGDREGGPVPERLDNGFIRIGVGVLFHLDVLKPPLPKRDASDGAPGANTKKQMSLELDDLR
ncbi:hypothetical protein [Paraburkholderia aspalathi]|uniref:hypothetical protein n=1 Tax=Paraburkholderia aspalathi TaxID=1324617 RepID=UPI001BA6341A|nr:hypothetical protein [Paraburkholderia aspalathi]